MTIRVQSNCRSHCPADDIRIGLRCRAGVNFGDERPPGAPSKLSGFGEIAGRRKTSDVGVTRGVYGNATTAILVTSAEVAGVYERSRARFGGVKLRDESITNAAVKRRLEHSGGG